jgi:hypothetical protein
MKLPNNLFPEFDNPDEIHLLPSAGYMTYDDAMKYAADNGTRLPTKEELNYLIAVGKLKAGDGDMWSSSVNSFFRDNAWYFYSYYGSVSSDVRSDTIGARCVGRPCANTFPAASEAKPDRAVELLERIANSLEELCKR